MLDLRLSALWRADEGADYAAGDRLDRLYELRVAGVLEEHAGVSEGLVLSIARAFTAT